MCFSPQADLVGGLVVTGIGIDACRHLRGRNDHLLLAGLPLVLGAHQLVETFVWWGLDGTVPQAVGRAAMWIYLVVAFVVLPIFVPMAVWAIEPRGPRRQRMLPFVVLGVAVAVTLGAALVRGPVEVTQHSYHLAYSINLSHGGLVVAFYVFAICGALLFSGFRHIAIFGVANLIAVAILAWLTLDGFASLWCAYAALASGAIALHMRYAKASGDRPHVVTRQARRASPVSD